MYYLQSRYYDAITGKFINADVPEYCLLALNATGHNLLVYCINNPVNLSDSNGNIALVDDAAVWAFIGLCAVLMLLLAWMSTPQFQRAWIDFCTVAGNGLSWIATGIVNGGKAAWNWTRKQVKAATAAMGFGENYLRLPLVPMEESNEARLLELMREQGINV